MTQVYKIDDGCDHWVIAASVDDALSVCREMEGAPEPGDDDPPEVMLLTAEQARATQFLGDGYEDLPSTMQAEYERDPSRRYVGCSEW